MVDFGPKEPSACLGEKRMDSKCGAPRSGKKLLPQAFGSLLENLNGGQGLAFDEFKKRPTSG